MKQEALSFLEAMHGPGIDEGHGYAALWRLDRKETQLFDNVEAAAEWAAGLDGTSDVYTCVCLSPKGIAKDRRATAGNVTSLAGFFMDFDIAGDGHKKSNLPTGKDDILNMINDFGIQPTVFLETGHGYQGHWLLDEPLHLDDGNRQTIKTEMLRWQETWKLIARARGFTIDSVYDLARLCRIPGLANLKVEGDGARSALVELNDNRRYSFDQVQEYLIDPELVRMVEADRNAVDIKVSNINASDPLPSYLTFVIENDDRFAKTWNMDRRDLDGDPSGYDLALASLGVRMNWTDQEIADAIYLFRSKHGNKPSKGRRASYLASTIARARKIGGGMTYEPREVVVSKEPEAKSSGSAIPNKYENMNKALGISIIEIEKYGSDNSKWVFKVVGGKRVFFPKTSEMRSRSIFADRFMDIGFHMRASVRMWPAVLDVIAQNHTEIDDNGCTFFGETDLWLKNFCLGRELIHISELNGGANRISTLIVGDGASEKLCINIKALAQTIEMMENVKIPPNEMNIRAREWGLKPKEIMVGQAPQQLYTIKLEDAIERGLLKREDVDEWRTRMTEDTAENTWSSDLPEPARPRS